MLIGYSLILEFKRIHFPALIRASLVPFTGIFQSLLGFESFDAKLEFFRFALNPFYSRVGSCPSRG
jgi:hypothetical protein